MRTDLTELSRSLAAQYGSDKIIYLPINPVETGNLSQRCRRVSLRRRLASRLYTHKQALTEPYWLAAHLKEQPVIAPQNLDWMGQLTTYKEAKQLLLSAQNKLKLRG